jgi:hypothetical protein
MQLDRTGLFLSDRLVLGPENDIDSLHVDSSLWGWILRIISWIWSPACYSDENRRAVSCVKKYFIDTLGEERLRRICSRYSLNLSEMEEKGNPLLARHVAQIVIGSKDVKIEDVDEWIRHPERAPEELREKLRAVNCSEDLDSQTFADVVKALANQPEKFTVPEITAHLCGMCPSERTATWFFDDLLADRERLELCRENPDATMETFKHHFSTTIIGREMEVGMIIPAPNHEDGRPRSYKIGAKIITGEGMVAYRLEPATRDSDLRAALTPRGTAARPSAIDSSSTVITDFERRLGFTAWDSWRKYAPVLRGEFGKTEEAWGHSLGGVIIQRELIQNDELRKDYLFSSPGLAPDEVEAFNRRMEKADYVLENVVRDANTDYLSAVGHRRIGYQAPPNVKTHYLKYNFHHHKHLDTIPTGSYAHVVVPGRGHRHIDRNGELTPEEHEALIEARCSYSIGGARNLDDTLNLQDVEEKAIRDKWGPLACIIPTNETLRRTIGPVIAAIIRLVRDFFRWFLALLGCPSRTSQQLGIQIGKYRNGTWIKKHLRPEHLRYYRAPAAAGA